LTSYPVHSLNFYYFQRIYKKQGILSKYVYQEKLGIVCGKELTKTWNVTKEP
jgi:hypothetical protein